MVVGLGKENLPLTDGISVGLKLAGQGRSRRVRPPQSALNCTEVTHVKSKQIPAEPEVVASLSYVTPLPCKKSKACCPVPEPFIEMPLVDLFTPGRQDNIGARGRKRVVVKKSRRLTLSTGQGKESVKESIPIIQMAEEASKTMPPPSHEDHFLELSRSGEAGGN